MNELSSHHSEEFVTLSDAEKHQLRALYRRSNGLGILQLTAHVFLIALALWLVHESVATPWYLPSAFILGAILTFLFAPLHECIHRTAFRSRMLNDMVATATGFILWLPPNYFRGLHLAHHRWTQVKDRDPELTDKNLDTNRQLLLHLSGCRYWRGNITALIHHTRGRVKEPYINPSKTSAVIVEARCFLVTYALCLAGSIFASNGVLILYWWIPLLLGQPLLRLYLLAEHTLCPLTTDMFRNTRTTLTGQLLRFISWNMPYHTEHHASMAIPFHALPAAHQLLRSRVKTQTPGYIAFHRQLLETLRSR